MYKFWDKVRIWSWEEIEKAIYIEEDSKGRHIVITKDKETIRFKDIQPWREDDNELKEWDIVYGSCTSIEHAIESKIEYIYVGKIHEKALSKYVVIEAWFEKKYRNWEEFCRSVVDYVVKKQNKEYYTLEATDEQRKKIQNILDNN